MSLINQMLKDLEHRTKGVSNTTFALSYFNTSSSVSIKRITLLILITACLMSMISSFYFLKPLTHHDKVALKSMKAPSFIKELPQPISQEFTKPAESLHASASIVTGLTLQIQKPKTLLKFLLSQDTLYRIGKKSENEYVITLNHARLVSTLPAINTSNSGIDAIKMINEQSGDILIFLTLKEGTNLDGIALTNDTTYPELQINLTYKDDVAMHPVVAQLSDNTVIDNQPIVNNQLVKSLITTGPENDYQDALAYIAKGNQAQAIYLLTNIVSKFPDYVLARESLVKLLVEQKKLSEAKQVLQVGLKNKPLYSPFSELKARILATEGQVDDAISVLQQAAPSINQDPEYHALIAALYQQKGQSLLASKMYEQLLPLQPDNGVWWMGLGIAYEDLGKRNEAVQAYARADNSGHLNPELKAYIEERIHSLQ